MGELLLKQVLWFAQRNLFDLVYLTTFSEQTALIAVLLYYGFEKTGTNSLGEEIYEKPLYRDRLYADSDEPLFDLARVNYPRFVGRAPAEAFCVPIRGEYHNILFPELANRIQEDLFGLHNLTRERRTPGNTIRKVYLCRAPTTRLRPGSVLLFYRSQSPGYLASQSLTSVGVVEGVANATSLDGLVRLTGKRSVYSDEQLAAFEPSKDRPVKVIDFLLIGHLEPSIQLDDLKQEGVFKGPPQSITYLPPPRIGPVLERMSLGFEV